MSSRRPIRNAIATEPSAATIGFRLDPENRACLQQRAGALGISPHELAREYVIEMLQAEKERCNLHAALLDLHQALLRLRGDVATTAEAILIAAGEVDPKEARAYIERVFK